MKHFEYVPRKEVNKTKKEIIELINLVQKEVKDYFTFQYQFIGSTKLNCVTCDYSSNIGYDLDVNIMVNDPDESYSACEIKRILIKAFNKFCLKFNYDYCEDSTRVFTIKVKDRENSKIIHSCDFAIVNDYEDEDGDWRQEYIHFNKKQKTYKWQKQPDGFYNLEERTRWIKDNGLWDEFRELYLYKKNNNEDLNKKSRSLRAEAINEIYHKYQEQ